MSSGADLFVVCKQCGSEVSPYITECPYCGSRLRKRAPKLEKARRETERREHQTEGRLGRLRPGEIPGIRGEARPHATIVLVLGLGQPVEPLQRLAHDFGETVKRIARSGRALAVVRPPTALEQEMALAPRDAFLGRSQAVPVDEAIGRISCEAIAGYPPGVPSVLPGERVSAEVVAYLRELTGAGARLHGAADPSFATLRVLVLEPPR